MEETRDSRNGFVERRRDDRREDDRRHVERRQDVRVHSRPGERNKLRDVTADKLLSDLDELELSIDQPPPGRNPYDSTK